ncbi:PREDICTED: uncharacterized protein LOC104800502 [Tarenaya hassleriana]|uniref:uncharacterized protein LOC104800502 n=1 Tax=Tarenaya hassleriana TaxID=28532 RepID=UPI00053C1584|nr:PREDICTED: uncharacterized protein LOC104800502 [Tarenaya hassleriana]
MPRRVILRSSAINRGQPLLASLESSVRATVPGEKRKKAAEVAGGAAAGCAAVCCCCPCAVMNLVVLAVVRVPVAVCRKAWRRRKRRRLSGKRQGLLEAAAEASEVSGRLRLNGEDRTAEIAVEEKEKFGGQQNDAVAMEKEMWNHFYGAGFWRSSSQRDT